MHPSRAAVGLLVAATLTGACATVPPATLPQAAEASAAPSGPGSGTTAATAAVASTPATAAATTAPAAAATAAEGSATDGAAAGGDVDAGGPPHADPAALAELAVALEPLARLDAPTAATVRPADGALVVAERAGTVRVVGDDGTVGEPLVDLRGQVTTNGERGLLGIAFAADGAEAYLSYTGRQGESRLVAAPVRADGSIDAGAGRDLLVVDQPAANHNGGDVHLGPDGLLWWALGDGGGADDEFGHGQDPTTLLATIVRIDPRAGEPYGVPADNPWADGEDAAPEVWAYGLRNPWRFSFDVAAGRSDVWIADVGQQGFEEVNRLDVAEGGGNLGWPAFEGREPYLGDPAGPGRLVEPVFTYARAGGRCSITGGVVYRGAAIPGLRGAYLFSDFCDAAIRAIAVDGNGAVVAERDLGVQGGEAIVGFARDADGEVVVLSLAGAVARLVPA